MINKLKIAFIPGVLAIILTWFFLTHERIVVTEDLGFKKEARENPTLAAMLLTNELGIEANSTPYISDQDYLNHSDQTIVFFDTTEFFTGSDSFSTWLENGGHAVIFLWDVLDTEEAMKDQGFRLTEVIPEDSEEGASTEESHYILMPSFTYKRLEIVEGINYTAAATDEYGPVLLRRRYANGTITALYDPTLFYNQNLMQLADRPRLLMDAISLGAKPEKVLYVFGRTTTNFFTTLWNNFSLSLIFCMIALLLWIAATLPRFGPIWSPPNNSRRSTIEHLKAAGLFSWKHRKDADLLSNAINIVMRKAELRHPGLSKLTIDQQAEKLAHYSNIDKGSLVDLLTTNKDLNGVDFIEQIQILKRIRETL